MAFELKLDVHTSSDCANLVITENSGTYSLVNNSTGWGSPNITPDNKILTIGIQPYVPVVVNAAGDKKIISPILVYTSTQSQFTDFQVPFNIQSVKMSLTYSDIYSDFYYELEATWVSLGLTTVEKDYVLGNITEWETLQDHIYIVTAALTDQNFVDLGASAVVKHSSVCNIEKKVKDMFTKIDLRCEDCDDEDLKDVALYNALLQNLKNA